MGNVNMEATQINYRGGAHKKSVANALKEIDNYENFIYEKIEDLYTRDATRATKESIAPDYTSETNYYVGDLVWKDNQLYKCINNHPAGTEWSLTDFEVEDVSSYFVDQATDIDELKSGLTNLTDAVGWDNHYNQWDETWEVGSIDTTTGANVENSTVIRSKGYIAITPNTSYYFKSPNVAVAFFYDSNKTYIAQSSANIWEVFTAPANAYYMRFRTSSDYGNTYNNNVSINYPSTITGYYAGHPVIGPAVVDHESRIEAVESYTAVNTIYNPEQRAWSGSSLVYNIPLNSLNMIHFIACQANVQNSFVEAYFVLREQTQTIIVQKSSEGLTLTYDSTTKKTTVTLPATGYWIERMEMCARSAS